MTLALLLLAAFQEEVKDGRTYVHRGHKLTFSIPSAPWGTLRHGGTLEWRWTGGVAEFLDAKGNLGGCLTVEAFGGNLDEAVQQFEEGLKKNDGSKKLERKGDPRETGKGRVRRDYSWDYKEWNLTYVVVFFPIDKQLARLAMWLESKHWAEYEAAVNGIVDSFRSTEETARVAHPWASAGAGSWVEHKIRDKSGERATKRTLVSKTADELVFQVDGQEAKEKATIDAPAEPTARGEEVLEVAGKKLKCAWSEAGKKKTWTCDDVPGGLVKSVEGDTEILLTGFEKK